MEHARPSNAVDWSNLPPLLTEDQAAELLQVSPRTLQRWRFKKRRPPLWKVMHGKIIRYPTQALIEWINSDTRELSAMCVHRSRKASGFPPGP